MFIVHMNVCNIFKMGKGNKQVIVKHKRKFIVNVPLNHVSKACSSELAFYLCYIRIYYECEGRIEKSIPRIATWHAE